MKHSLLLCLFLSASTTHAMKKENVSSSHNNTPPRPNEWKAEKTLTQEDWKRLIAQGAKPIEEPRHIIHKDGTIERIEKTITCECIIF